MPKLSKNKQIEILKYLCDYRKGCLDLMKKRKEILTDIYRVLTKFKDYEGSGMGFVVNKAHEITEKIVPRIIANPPTWIVTPRKLEAFTINGEELIVQDGESQVINETVQERSSEFAAATQDYLTYIFDEYGLLENFKIIGKADIRFGKAYAKPKWKYEISRKGTSDAYEGSDEEDNFESGVEEEVSGFYPTVENISWTQIWYDPRKINMEDQPGVGETIESVRLADLYRRKERDSLFNLDKVEALCESAEDKEKKQGDYRDRVKQLAGIPLSMSEVITKDSLDIHKFYGYYSLTGKAKDERLYEVWSVADMFIIKFKEITRIPIYEVKCFPDTESAFAVGFVEPILSLQDELNWKKNSAAEYINKSLQRQRLWSPQSGINPRDADKPIIPTTKDGQTALANFPELPHRDINPSYFQEGNDFERQIQGMTFTVDTANPKSQQALTNTATGIRVKFFESNAVIDEVRKSFERFLEKIAYELLLQTFENMDENIVFKKQGTDEYWNINKEMLRDAVIRYNIKVETNSSAFDDIESRRENEVALWNVALQAKEAGEPVKLGKHLEDVYNTFEKKDPKKYIGQSNPADVVPPPVGQGGQIAPPQRSQNPSAELTEQVAGGNFDNVTA